MTILDRFALQWAYLLGWARTHWPDVGGDLGITDERRLFQSESERDGTRSVWAIPDDVVLREQGADLQVTVSAHDFTVLLTDDAEIADVKAWFFGEEVERG